MIKYTSGIVPIVFLLLLSSCYAPSSSVFVEVNQVEPVPYTEIEKIVEKIRKRFPELKELPSYRSKHSSTESYGITIGDSIYIITVATGKIFIRESPAKNYEMKYFRTKEAKEFLEYLKQIMRSEGHEIFFKGPYDRWSFFNE
jgi:hypothetical protein